MPAERIRLRVGDLSRAVLITGQAYQDPKDALNELVSNAADEYAQSERRGARIRIILRRKGKRPVIAVEDEGRGMSPDRMREVARSLFKSVKAGDPRTIGEKAIGILAFQQLAGRCDIVSRAEGSTTSHVLRLERGSATARLDRAERWRIRSTPGTTVYLSDLDPDALRVLTRRKMVDYLTRRRSVALERGDYVIEVVEGRTAERVTPHTPDGVRLAIPSRNTLWGRIEFSLHVAPVPDQRRRVAVVGRGGTTIIDDIAELDEFSDQPWPSDQIGGMIAFDALQQTAGRRALLRDREAFPVFVEAVRSVEPAVRRVLERIAREVDAGTVDRLADAIRRIFGKVLKELDDLDNPMRAIVGGAAGEGALLEEPGSLLSPDPPSETSDESEPAWAPIPSAADLAAPTGQPDEVEATPPPAAGTEGGRSRSLPVVAPDPNPDGVRSRYDADERVVYFNDQHADYLLVKEDETALLEYLSTLVAKELVIYNNPRSQPGDLGEEMVRMLVRIRRHMPKRR